MPVSNIVYEKIVENLHDGLYFVDRDRNITYWNKAAEAITGFPANQVIGSCCWDNILCHVDGEGNRLCKGQCPLARTIEDGQPREAEVYLHHRNGHRVPVFVRISPLTDDDGNIVGGVELFTDISHLAANTLRVKELEKMALLDKLTQLANRAYLEKELVAYLEERKRAALSIGILFMDVDHFKNFNDQYGHDVGDEVLKQVANTLVSNARPFDIYGRWGGEEFMGIIRNITADDLEKLGDRMRALVEQSFLMRDGAPLHTTISIGATLALETDTMESLVKRADMLLYQSKQAGRNRLTLG